MVPASPDSLLEMQIWREAGKVAEQEVHKLTSSQVSWIQRANTHVNVNNSGKDLKTGRTTSTTKGREEDTSERVGRMEMQWRVKQTSGSPWEGGSHRAEKGKKQTVTPGHRHRADRSS